MTDEISVSAVLIEMDDGSYRADCPDLVLSARGKNADGAIRNLKDLIARHVKEKGASNIHLCSVKCVKIKVPLK